MTFRPLTIIISIMVLVAMVSLVLSVHSFLGGEENHIKEVPCFDKYSNEIKGAVCEEKVYPLGEIFFNMIILVFMLIFLTLAVELDKVMFGRRR